MNWEIGIDRYTLPRVKQIAKGNLLYSAGNSARCSVVTQMGGMGMRGGMGRGGGREVQEGGDMGMYVYI